MSGYTMTQTELLYASYVVATTSVPTAAAVTITAGMPTINVPAGFMSGGGKRTPSLRLRMEGYLTATATVPTWSFGLSAGTTTSFSATGPLATPTAAVAPTAGSGSFTLDADIGLRTLGVGAASTIWCSGVVTSNLFAAAPLKFNPGGSGGTSYTTWQDDVEYFLWPYLTLSAATALNTVTVQYAKLYGEN
jgi:hypothetical protein